MKDKQFVIATLLLLVGLHTFRCTFALSPVARFLDIIKVPELERRLESIILRMQNRANPGGVLDNINGEDAASGNSAPIPGLMSVSNSGGIFGRRRDPEFSTINQVVGGRMRNGLFGQLFKE